jgi:alginate O-acetyltransferase complex protein AlgI
MVFSSILFLVYFLPIFFIIYYAAPKAAKNIVILVGSILFYAWGAPKFIFVILGTTLLDFFLVNAMENSTDERKRRVMLLVSLSVNLGLLFYFKYSNFFIENVNAGLGLLGAKNVHWTKLALPIGISFYTFETLTYVIDVYRRVHKPLKNFWDYQLYIILFPKLIAGPITRYHEISDQITNRDATDNIDYKLTGFYRFVIGLAKKVLIANIMGAQADAIMNHPYPEINSYMAWLGAIAYTFQIYFDFSGYSDMAIGLGKMMGFRFPENFNSPYTAGSITEFWRRWHITLGAWMRNYLYIPLGGNQVTATRLYMNLWLVFLASGLWHGASWSFVFWGAYHGAFLVIERMGLGKILDTLWRPIAALFTFILVVLGWVFFRIEKLSEAMKFVKIMFRFDFKNYYFFPNNDFYIMAGVAAFFAFFAITPFGERIQNFVFARDEYATPIHAIFMTVCMVLLLLCIASITTSTFNPFIYFRF